jgi:hypothetical protein
MTRAQVQDALERLLSASVDRALRILQKGGDAEAARIFLSLVDRSVGPVPSASYVAANISGGGNEAKIVTADEIRATVLGYAARLAAREIDGADHRD